MAAAAAAAAAASAAATPREVPPIWACPEPPTAVNAGGGHSHHFHSQTPTSIKLATLPSYLGEWTKNGFEEAMFLGAQVASRLAFTIHNLDCPGPREPAADEPESGRL